MIVRPKISVVIPCYNEAEVIVETLDAIANFFNSHDWPFEIIVIDDASNDNTFDRAIERNYSWVKVFRNEVNRGKGYSVKRGVVESTGELVLFCDADMSTPIEEILKLEKYIDEYDIVIASRAIGGAQVVRYQPFYKVIAGKLGNLWVRLILGLNFKDTQCGFKLFDRSALPVFSKQTIDRWGFDFELLFIAKKMDLDVKEVGVVWTNDIDSKVTLGGYFKTIVEVLKVRLNYWQGKYK